MSIPPLDNTLGAVLIGVLVATGLYGITCIQTYMYWFRQKDHWPLRTAVAALWVIDTLHVFMLGHFLYHYTVSNFGKPLALLVPAWSIYGEISTAIASDTTIRAIFTFRIWSLSRNVWLTAFVGVNSLLVSCGALAALVKAATLNNYARFSEISWLIYWMICGTVFVDITIAGTMCYLLNKMRTGFRRTDFQIQTLMVYIINTGVLTSIAASACMLCYALMKDNFVFIGIMFTLPTFFLNSLLATLNARKHIKDMSSDIQSVPLSKLGVSSIEFGTPQSKEWKGLDHDPEQSATLHEDFDRGIPLSA